MIERLKQNHFLWFQGPMVVWAIALFVQSSIPGDQIPDLEIFTYDKLIHFFIYVVFAAAVYRGIRFQNRFPILARHYYSFTFMIVAVYGASDELHQLFVPNRSCSLLDWMADSVGAALFVLCHYFVQKRRGNMKAATEP